MSEDLEMNSENSDNSEMDDSEVSDSLSNTDSYKVIGVYSLSKKTTAELKRIVTASKPAMKFGKSELLQLVSSLDSLRYTIGYNPVYPCTFVMHGVREFQKSGKEWYSEPFYTWPRGYKMCLGVYANGSGRGEGTHLSVCLHRMWGEFDYYLKGPIRGSVTVQLVSDENPTDKFARCEAETVIEFESRKRVTSGKMNKGWSNTSSDTFISMRKLKNVVDNDRLYFKVTRVVCRRI